MCVRLRLEYYVAYLPCLCEYDKLTVPYGEMRCGFTGSHLIREFGLTSGIPHHHFSLPPPLTGPCGKGDFVEQCALADQTPAVVLRLTEALERLGEFAP